MEFAVGIPDREIVDAREPPLHQACGIKFPVLVSIGAEPVAAVVVPLIGITDSDAIVSEGPEFLDQPIVKFLCPFAGQKRHDLGAAVDEFSPVPPAAVRRVSERNLFRIAAIPTVFSKADLLYCSIAREGWGKGHFAISVCGHMCTDKYNINQSVQRRQYPADLVLGRSRFPTRRAA